MKKPKARLRPDSGLGPEELAVRFDVEVAWFYEHCPDPEKWFAEHGESVQAVWDYITQYGPRAGVTWPKTS